MAGAPVEALDDQHRPPDDPLETSRRDADAAPLRERQGHGLPQHDVYLVPHLGELREGQAPAGIPDGRLRAGTPER